MFNVETIRIKGIAVRKACPDGAQEGHSFVSLRTEAQGSVPAPASARNMLSAQLIFASVWRWVESIKGVKQLQ